MTDADSRICKVQALAPLGHVKMTEGSSSTGGLYADYKAEVVKVAAAVQTILVVFA